jgi:hypothetical protein
VGHKKGFGSLTAVVCTHRPPYSEGLNEQHRTRNRSKTTVVNEKLMEKQHPRQILGPETPEQQCGRSIL